MQKSKNKLPGLVVTGILTAITVLFWIGFEVYRIFTTQPPATVPQEIILPLDPNLNQEVLGQMTNRIKLENFITATPEPTQTPEASPSATFSPTPEPIQ